MQTYLKIPMYTAILALIMIVAVPRKDIRQLAVYGIIFGGIIDIITLSFGKLFDLFEFIDFAPLGYWVIPFFSPIAWAVYYVMYFYFLPKQKPLMYVYVASGIIFSILFTQLLLNSNIMVANPKLFSMPVTRIVDPLCIFSIWFPFSTWGYLKLSGYFEGQKQESR